MSSDCQYNKVAECRGMTKIIYMCAECGQEVIPVSYFKTKENKK